VFTDGVRRAAHKFAGVIAATPPWAVLATAWLLLIIYAFPGQMTQDSFDHLSEARSGFYTDSHPPAINLLWRFVEYFVAGPFGMLVIQSSTFVVGLYLVMRRAFAPRAAAWAAALLFLFPPVMLPFAVIWKDCFMAGFLMLGAAGLLASRRWLRIAGLVALWGATAVRYNAFAATFPLVLFLFRWRDGVHWLQRCAIACVAWFAVTAAAFGFNAKITDRQMHFWHSSLAVFDIVGTLAFVERDLPDAEMRTLLEGTELTTKENIHGVMKNLYTPRDFLPILNHPTQGMWALPIWGIEPAPVAQRDAIERVWKQVVTTHPLEYLKHRLSVMGEVLSLSSSHPAATVIRREYRRPDLARALDLTATWSTLQHKATKFMVWLWRTTPVFVPWVYAVIALLLLPLARRHRDVLALLFSGLLMESSLLVLAPSPDYRYSHWMVVCTLVSVILLTARRAVVREERMP
jgi:hypothetical protein